MFGFKYDYENFPKWELDNDEVEVVQGDVNHRRVRVLPPVVYATKDDYDLHIRFVVPQEVDESKKYPLIMHVRGSAWMEQNLEGIIGDFYEYVKAGYAIAILRYRPATTAKFPAQVLDIKTAVRYIQEHAEEYPIDSNCIFLSGDSSGGHIASLAYLTWNEDVLDNEEETTPLPQLKGYIDYFGVTDPEHLSKTETGLPVEANAGIGEMLFERPASEDPSVFAQGNVACYIDLREKLEPVLLLHGNKDRLVPLCHSTRFFELLKNRGVDAKMYMINDADHEGTVFWCDVTKNLAIDFLNKHQ